VDLIVEALTRARTATRPYRVHARRRLAEGLRAAAVALRQQEAPVETGPTSAALTPEPPAPRVAEAAAATPPEVEPPAAEPPAAEAPAAPAAVDLDVHDRIVSALHTVFDPEIPVDVYELGLIYAIDVDEDRMAHVRMTLTSPNCPSAAALPAEIEQKVRAVPGVEACTVDVVFEPPWTPDRMSEEARLQLNLG
jgi:FeS assembly SUF system protein